MKIRQGFVSNSSTSSFLLIGVKTTYEKLPHVFCDKWGGIKREIKDEFNLGQINDNGDTVYVGYILCEEIEDNVYDFTMEDLNNPKINVAKQKLEELFPDLPIKMYCGSISN